MGRRRPVVPPIINNWLRASTFTFQEKRQNGKYVEQTLERGDKFKVVHEQGWFIFLEHVTNLNNDKQWIDCVQLFGLKEERGPMRAFRPERVSKKFRVIKRRKPRKQKQEREAA